MNAALIYAVRCKERETIMPNAQDFFPSNYLKASDLKGRSIAVTIDRVEMEAVGQKKEMKPVLYFAGKEKGMVLNKTNTNKIMQITASPVTEEWEGHAIVIYPTETSFQGDMVDCVRVRAVPAGNGKRTTAAAPKRPEPKPVPEPEPESELDEFIDDDSIPF